MDCKRNDKAGRCLAEFIEIGKRWSGGLGCVTFEADHEWLRGEFSRRMRDKRRVLSCENLDAPDHAEEETVPDSDEDPSPGGVGGDLIREEEGPQFRGKGKGGG